LEIFNNWSHISVNVPGLLPVEHNTQRTPHLLEHKSISGAYDAELYPFQGGKVLEAQENPTTRS
jgi:hypothetical protein